MSNSSLSSLSTSPRNQRRRGHRRHASDPKALASISPLRDDKNLHKDLERSIYGASLRDSAINSVEDEDEDLLNCRLLEGCRSTYRRNSESGLGSDLWGRSITPTGTASLYESSLGGRQKAGRKPRKPRSWHPSPYASDDEDDMFSREEKKQKIKAEIARRRQQIEENARLHEELLRLARLRESAE
ncbi:hypothetical protein Avbf_06841, partial [Armadillidium vulgare]